VLKVLEFLRVLVGEEEEVRPTRLTVAMLRDTIPTFGRVVVRRHDLRLSIMAYRSLICLGFGVLSLYCFSTDGSVLADDLAPTRAYCRRWNPVSLLT
jgi:hypothetical protein